MALMTLVYRSPIMSYRGQGTGKSGVKAEHHAIIHTTEYPVSVPGEKEMTLSPLRVKPDHPVDGLLDQASRLNYAKFYTVEHNVKVWFIARLAKAAEHRLQIEYDLIHPPLGQAIATSAYGSTSNEHAGSAGDPSGTGSYNKASSGNYNVQYGQNYGGRGSSAGGANQTGGSGGGNFQHQDQFPEYPDYQSNSQSLYPPYSGYTANPSVSYSQYNTTSPTTYAPSNTQYSQQPQNTYQAYQQTSYAAAGTYQDNRNQPSYQSSGYPPSSGAYQSNNNEPPTEDYDTQDHYYRH